MEKDMTVGNPTKMILNFTIPLFIGNVFQQLYNMADTIIVGKFVGANALAAVGSTGTIMFLIIGFLQGMTAGFTVPTAQKFGAGDMRSVRKTVGSAAILSLIVSAIMTVISMVGMRWLLHFMNTPDNIFDDAYRYIMVICAGIFAQVLYNLLASILRALGNSKTPLYFLILAAVLNIILDLVFIIVFHMGAAGAAYATVIAQGISGVLCLVYIIRKVPILRLTKEDWKLDGTLVKIQFGIGFPMAFQYSITAIGAMMMQSSLNILGSVAIAGFTAASKIEQLVTQAYVALGTLLLKLSIPMMISMLVQALYNVVDSVFVSHVSESALTAVSLAFSLQNVMIAVGVGTGVGVNALLSKSLGEKNQSRANATAENGIFLSLCSFAVFFVIGLTCMKPYFYAQTSDAVIAQQGIQYLSVCCIFSLGLFTQTMGEKLLAATGRTYLSMISQLVGAVVNIILDPIFIFGYCGEALSGTTGAAVATVIGQFCGAGMTLYFNTRKNPDIQISFKGFRPSAKAIGRIYTVGLPSIAMQCVGSLMTFGMNLILMAFSATAVAVFGVYFKLQSFVFMPIFGLNNGMVPIISYNYGARRPNRVKKTIKLAVCYAEGIMLAGFCIFQFAPRQVLSIFAASDAMLAIGIPAMRIICLHFLLAGVSIVLSSVFQALGNGVFSLIVSVCRQLFVLLPAAWLLAQTGSVNNVWWAFLIAEFVSVLMSLAFYARINKTTIAPLYH